MINTSAMRSESSYCTVADCTETSGDEKSFLVARFFLVTWTDTLIPFTRDTHKPAYIVLREGMSRKYSLYLMRYNARI